MLDFNKTTSDVFQQPGRYASCFQTNGR